MTSGARCTKVRAIDRPWWPKRHKAAFRASIKTLQRSYSRAFRSHLTGSLYVNYDDKDQKKF